MSSLDPVIIKRKIVGTWQLPIHHEYSETITLMGFGSKFSYTCSAADVRQRFRQLFTGSEIRGNWHIRNTIKETSDSKSSVGGSVTKTVGGSVRISTGFLTAPFLKEQQNSSARSELLESDRTGPFLFLNFDELTQSILNIPTPRGRIELGNLLNNLRQVFEEDYFKIVSLTDNDTRLLLRTKTGNEVVWTKFQEDFGGG
ncbi:MULTISPECIES: hypothetical protein [Fischerella]|uniref:hypothetical protein n=1 Tax=Fischerella TaxID=1190 RepID=UPI0002F2A6F6|nr:MULTISPECIES: hypothetical protein [Fischerella]MBD2432080.1 hypothetical protein [Fischerella sp. FACHB-380]